MTKKKEESCSCCYTLFIIGVLSIFGLIGYGIESYQDADIKEETRISDMEYALHVLCREEAKEKGYIYLFCQPFYPKILNND